MVKKVSAGILLYRRRPALEVLLVHPGGPFWAKKDLGAWTIPKGEVAEGEEARAAALREFEEETGRAIDDVIDEAIDGVIEALEPVRQAGGKIVRAWAVEGDLDPEEIRSNTFTIEWPPRSGRQREFPEIDRAEWLTIDEARRKIIAGQLPLLDELQRRIALRPS